MRVLSRGCGIDAGGRTLTWVDDVRPADSLRVLSSLVTAPEGERDKRSESALMAIAVHEGPAADDVLERWLDPAQPVRIRKQTAFWMGNLRGRRGYEGAGARPRQRSQRRGPRARRLRADPERRPESGGRDHPRGPDDGSAHVRGQAMFWLGQSGDARALAFFQDVLARP